ncbi:MAG: UDP-N-acetylmuramoyl-tripeptide--D-alanyl-D-alanine ligase, partial [Oscillospiraceae bacterium]
MKLTLKEIAFWSGGTLIGDGNLEITEFFTDSRQGGKGKMFVPVKGEKVDAHRFISAVFAQGACTFSEQPI